MQHELQRNSDTMSPYNRMFYDMDHMLLSMKVNHLWFYDL